jgi:lipopolysaccharide transport system ATP-binding protein
MSDVVIKAEGVGKKYIIRHEGQENYTALRDVIQQKSKGLFAKNKRTKEEFWALKDISFEVKQGEAIGIIGRNGAGKSTLLKILSRITEPTEGRVTLNGQTSSLLEIGTGFHPELTGRENIFLNGAVLGMTRAEIKKKFDSIVEFSGVEKFLDTPVKRYSSGMYLRLAFAVAAYLEPDILIVDEVFAVGDAEFQKKCLGKMDEVSRKEGRTVLFVSHNTIAIESLCSRGFLLENGRIYSEGPIKEVISNYASMTSTIIGGGAIHKIIGEGAVIQNFRFSSGGKEIYTGDKIMLGQDLQIEIEITAGQKMRGLSVAIDIKNIYGELYSHIINEDDGYIFPEMEKGEARVVTIKTSPILYVPGDYIVDLWIGSYQTSGYYSIKNALHFSLEQSNIVGRKMPLPQHTKVYLASTWN